MSEYDEVDEGDVVASWKRTHKNDEQTWVSIAQVAGKYLVVVVDVDRYGREVLDEEIVATTYTDEEAREKAKSWMDENPKGLGGGGLGGLLG